MRTRMFEDLLRSQAKPKIANAHYPLGYCNILSRNLSVPLVRQQKKRTTQKISGFNVVSLKFCNGPFRKRLLSSEQKRFTGSGALYYEAPDSDLIAASNVFLTV